MTRVEKHFCEGMDEEDDSFDTVFVLPCLCLELMPSASVR